MKKMFITSTIITAIVAGLLVGCSGEDVQATEAKSGSIKVLSTIREGSTKMYEVKDIFTGSRYLVVASYGDNGGVAIQELSH